MTKKEFNLSECIQGNVVHEWHIRKFIKKLKKLQGEWTKEMDKLAGDKFK